VAPEEDSAIQRRLERVRTIGSAPIPKETDGVNKELDEIGKFLTANTARALPSLKRELEKELGTPSPNQFFLLDMGYAAARLGDVDTATRALLRIDVKHEMIRGSSGEMFYFTHKIARLGRPEVLPVIDRVVLDANFSVFIPEHVLQLDSTLQGAFLYGVLGPSTEKHVASLLDSRPDKIGQLLEILNWLGTGQSVAAVVHTVELHPDAETVKRAVGFFMRVGGASGREAILKLDRKRLEPAAKEYVTSIEAVVTKTTFASIAKELGGNARTLSDADLRKRLDAMVEHDGIDEDTPPAAILGSTIPTSELLERLAHVRSSTFRRLSDEALSDVQITNALINAVEYRK
jgi:hypothetical protein